MREKPFQRHTVTGVGVVRASNPDGKIRCVAPDKAFRMTTGPRGRFECDDSCNI